MSDPNQPTTMSMRSQINLFNEVMKIQDLSIDFMSSQKLPTLMILGGREQVGCLQSSRAVFQAIDVNEKNFISYDDCDHYLLADGEWVDVAAKATVGWMDSIQWDLL